MSRDLVLILILGLLMLAWLGKRTQPPEPEPSTISLVNVLGEAPEQFRRVLGPEDIEFPRDHAVHTDYRSEWWYFTGNLVDDDGRPFGFQFTLFRFGQTPELVIDSAWASDQLWMAHLALSDIDQERFYQAERFARGALGLAGANERHWWLRDWQVVAEDDGWRLQATTPEFDIDLIMHLTRPIVFQGDRGYSRKGPEPGNASRYYSATRLASHGQIRLGERKLVVEGLAWLDREWGSGQLAEEVEGWDWFALHLDDGRDLMIYRLRQHDGTASPWSAGVLVQPDGQSQVLTAGDFEARPGAYWRDSSGVRWPLEWDLDLPSENLALAVKARFEAQRWTRSVPYWEGSVSVSDRVGGQTIGLGYLELSGYAGDDRQ